MHPLHMIKANDGICSEGNTLKTVTYFRYEHFPTKSKRESTDQSKLSVLFSNTPSETKNELIFYPCFWIVENIFLGTFGIFRGKRKVLEKDMKVQRLRSTRVDPSILRIPRRNHLQKKKKQKAKIHFMGRPIMTNLLTNPNLNQKPIILFLSFKMPKFS